MQTFIEDALATHRLTRLVTTDEIAAPVRELIWKNFPPESTKLGYLITCPWCTSIWVGAGVALARRYVPGWSLLAPALAASSVAGIVESRV